MSTWTAYHNRSISPQEQTLYNHLLQFAEYESPAELIDRFQALFIEGVGYIDREIVGALDEIVASKHVEDYFRYILNRCCHILVNRWQSRPQYQAAIPALIECLEQGPRRPVSELSRSRQVRKLRNMVAAFRETEQFLTLRRLARVIDTKDVGNFAGNRPLGTLIRRYPYLYEHCLVSEDSTQEHQNAVRRIQAEAQHQFEVNLSQYVTYRVRRARLQHQVGAANARDRLRPIENPTLLSDRDLVLSLNQFSKQTDSGIAYRNSAQRFVTQHHQDTFGHFKADLYDYLTASIAPGYGGRKFNTLLSDQLSGILSNNDAQPLSDFLLVRTCSQLLNFLVVDSPRNPQHFVFLDLVNNLGPLLTTGLLLKILLICRKVKPYLERRFSILFNHYESTARDVVSWLIQILENMNVALSLTFGSVDVSHMLAV
ncbi:MAG: hypothetical protein IGR92_13855 [Leptolyngbyaceae cyanobacterium T60_A2020_046]|nr:hypothetical protein [Leptolyngbyaceae cyanobacterium T60_A2020_046]